MAVSGHNGDNESFIGFSSSISLSFYDENLNKMRIKNVSPIEVIIPRDPTVTNTQYQYVNISQINLSNGSLFLNNGFYVSQTNASVHLELKPLNLSISYLIVMKLSSTPIVNSTYTDFDFYKMICACDKFFSFFFFVNPSFG